MFCRRACVVTFIGLQGFWIAAAIGQVTEQVSEAAKEEAIKEAPKVVQSDAAADPSGNWKWQYEFGENKMDAQLKLDWDGKKLTGKYTAREATSEIRDAKLEKDALSFSTVRTINGNDFEIKFRGQLKADEIVGKVTIDFGESRDFAWNAKRVVEADDVLGEWALRVDTPNGIVEPKLTITKDDKGNLAGKYVSVFGAREPQNLTLKDSQLSWEISSNDDDQFDFKIVYKGNPRGNKIDGASEFRFGDNTGTMKFTGKRTPPEAQKHDRSADTKSAESAETTPKVEPRSDAVEAAQPAATDAEAPK